MTTSLKWRAENADSIICAHHLTVMSLYLCQTSAFDSFCCFSKRLTKKQAPNSQKFATASCGKRTVTSVKGDGRQQPHKKPTPTKKTPKQPFC